MKKIWGLGFFRDVVTNKQKFNALQEKEYVRYDDLPLGNFGREKDRRRVYQQRI